MSRVLSPQLANGDDETKQQQPRSDLPTSFVVDRPYSGPGRSNNNTQRFPTTTTTNGAYNTTTDAESRSSLLEHLASDLANLLNRTDISDCFLNVQGTFMAVHKCILAARSNAFAGNHDE